MNEEIVWYGPHECGVCGVIIIKAALDQGGEEFEPPPILKRVFDRGSECGNPNIAYPMIWKHHVHDLNYKNTQPNRNY